MKLLERLRNNKKERTRFQAMIGQLVKEMVPVKPFDISIQLYKKAGDLGYMLVINGKNIDLKDNGLGCILLEIGKYLRREHG